MAEHVGRECDACPTYDMELLTVVLLICYIQMHACIKKNPKVAILCKGVPLPHWKIKGAAGWYCI